MARLHDAATAARFAARHPKRAYLAVWHAAHRPPGAEIDPDPFVQAMELLSGSDVSLTFERGGVEWTVPPGRDGIAEGLFHDGAYGGGVLEAVLAFVAEHRAGHEWVVDVGANIGTSCIPFASAGFRVLAIEPVPTTLRYLRRNLAANGFVDQVHVVEAAVASGVDEVELAVSTSLGNSEVLSSPTADPAFAELYARAGTVRARATGLDDAVRSAAIDPRSVALVWSDTQGSETAVLETGASLWAAGVPLVAELWPRGLEDKGGIGAFVDRASEHFAGFIDCANDGVLIAEWAPRPVRELHEVAEQVRYYPGHFTDVLLLPATSGGGA